MQIDETSSYLPPVNQLLTYGKTEPSLPDTWPNYLELGFGPEHIPELIRMAADKKLNDVDIDDDIAGWAPIHAYRVLGQLHTEAAVEPLLSILEFFVESNDFAMEELPYVFPMIGPAALPRMTEYVANSSHDQWARITAMEGIEKIGLAWPETRLECVAFLTAQLELFEENDYDVNAFLIKFLVALHATEAAPLIERAFTADRVEEFLLGDWDDAQVSLGLKSAEEVEEKRSREREIRRQQQGMPFFSDEDEDGDSEYTSPSPQKKSAAVARKKAKNKMAKQSRKKNRKR